MDARFAMLACLLANIGGMIVKWTGKPRTMFDDDDFMPKRVAVEQAGVTMTLEMKAMRWCAGAGGRIEKRS